MTRSNLFWRKASTSGKGVFRSRENSLAIHQFFMSRDWRDHVNGIFRCLLYISRYGRTPMGDTVHWPMSWVHRAAKDTDHFLREEEAQMKKARRR